MIKIREAQRSDFNSFYALKCEKESVIWGGYDSAPQKDKLKDWYVEQLLSSTRKIYFSCLDDNSIVGFCYVDLINKDTIEISYGISSKHTGRGIATFMIYSVINKYTNGQFNSVIAWVSEKNEGSKKILKKNGFTMSTEKQIRHLPLAPDASYFYLWKRNL